MLETPAHETAPELISDHLYSYQAADPVVSFIRLINYLVTVPQFVSDQPIASTCRLSALSIFPPPRLSLLPLLAGTQVRIAAVESVRSLPEAW